MKTPSVHVYPNKHNSLAAGHEKNYEQALTCDRNMAKKNLPSPPPQMHNTLYLWNFCAKAMPTAFKQCPKYVVILISGIFSNAGL